MRQDFVRALFCAALWLAVPLESWAADLAEIYQRARANDPTYEAARYTLEAALQKVPQARAGLLPSVSVTGNDSSTRAQTTFSDTPTVERNVRAWTYALQLTQPLIRFQNFYAYSESERLAEQAEAQFALAEQDLILRVAQTYFDVLVAEESVTAVAAQVRALNEQWRQAKRGYETGVAAITDMYDAKSKLEQARSQEVSAQNDLETKRTELERLIGTAPARLSSLGPEAGSPRIEPQDPQAWADRAAQDNPTVRMQRAAEAAADAEVQRNRAEYTPTLDLTMSSGANYSSGTLANPVDFSTRVRSSQAGVQFTIPIFSGGGTSSRVAEAIANKRKAAAQLEEARRKARADAKEAYAGVLSATSQIDALKAALEAGQNAVKGNKTGYALGIRINNDVLSAEQQLYQSRRDFAKARYEALMQGLKLKAASGILGESEVTAINAMLTHQ